MPYKCQNLGVKTCESGGERNTPPHDPLHCTYIMLRHSWPNPGIALRHLRFWCASETSINFNIVENHGGSTVEKQNIRVSRFSHKIREIAPIRPISPDFAPVDFSPLIIQTCPLVFNHEVACSSYSKYTSASKTRHTIPQLLQSIGRVTQI